jgi:hypothetical protein
MQWNSKLNKFTVNRCTYIKPTLEKTTTRLSLRAVRVNLASLCTVMALLRRGITSTKQLQLLPPNSKASNFKRASRVLTKLPTVPHAAVIAVLLPRLSIHIKPQPLGIWTCSHRGPSHNLKSKLPRFWIKESSFQESITRIPIALSRSSSQASRCSSRPLSMPHKRTTNIVRVLLVYPAAVEFKALIL